MRVHPTVNPESLKLGECFENIITQYSYHDRTNYLPVMIITTCLFEQGTMYICKQQVCTDDLQIYGIVGKQGSP